MRWQKVALVAAAAVAVLAAGCGPMSRSQRAARGAAGWGAGLGRVLPVFGHRNWICIVDAAYPAQARASITTVATGADQLAAVKAALKAVDAATHVRPIIYLDAELDHVAEADAPGIAAYRTALKELLAQRPVTTLPHEEIIAKLDAAGETFRVLVLKTNLALPYTSVFLQLDCGYWSAEAEQRLRQAMPKTK